jgi:hypothetical protein
MALTPLRAAGGRGGARRVPWGWGVGGWGCRGWRGRAKCVPSAQPLPPCPPDPPGRRVRAARRRHLLQDPGAHRRHRQVGAYSRVLWAPSHGDLGVCAPPPQTPPPTAPSPFLRSTWLLKTVAGAGRPCLFVGDSGTNKTVTITAFLAGMDPSRVTSVALGFSSRTSSVDVQRALEDCLEKRTKVGRRRVGGGRGRPWAAASLAGHSACAPPTAACVPLPAATLLSRACAPAAARPRLHPRRTRLGRPWASG